ncbi:aspartate carbamoyltransferase catalytic subunit [Thermoactinomyces sp. AMNI-1]|uniref:Aspartate carbamoyltransferase n=2 Tax=Thermoactinomyces mirandus TaxID=2756294 RepID=A0A7W1XPY1_9BACL|nr:aspartate carbamoyltransferase catalytic subunit [Thermoactinomyces mirandus]
MKNLVDTKQLSKPELVTLLERARYWEEHWRPGCKRFQGQFAANLFFEPSTRTRFSFEVAEKRLGMEVINFTPEVSSTAKGETLYDTVKTLASVGVEVAVIRHSDPEAFLNLTVQEPGCALINAGAGCYAHPTQALLDLYTMVKQFGDLTGKKVAVVGDIRHSRVVRSNIWTLKQFGAEMMVSGPASMRDDEVEKMVPYVPFAEALQTADVVMMLRVQLERHHQKLFSSATEYHQQYGLTREKAAMLKPGAIIMHPGPVNRGVEIADEVVEHPSSRIFDQMTNGVWVRMAVIERALGGVN